MVKYEYLTVPPGRPGSPGPQNAVAPVIFPTSFGVSSTTRASPKGPLSCGRAGSFMFDITSAGVPGGTAGGGVPGKCSPSPLCSAQNAVRVISSKLIGGIGASYFTTSEPEVWKKLSSPHGISKEKIRAGWLLVSWKP